MEFKYSCIGDNSQENREWLEKLKDKTITWVSKDFELILSWENDIFFCDNKDIPDCLRGVSYINCIGNPQLFQAVSAIREDSDYMQWFTDGRYWFRCYNYDKVELEFRNKEGSAPWSEFPYKATLAELQEKFK